MRFWFSGPQVGPFRSGVSFDGKSQSQERAASGQFVYVIEGDHGAVKVGISSDPAARRATLQTGAPHRLFLTFSTWAGERAFDVEQEAHAILAAHRMPGEWFFVSKEIAIAAVYGAASRLGVSLGNAPAPRPKWPLLRAVWRSLLAFAAFCWILGFLAKITGH